LIPINTHIRNNMKNQEYDIVGTFSKIRLKNSRKKLNRYPKLKNTLLRPGADTSITGGGLS
jgi:hypothetical protein